MSMDQWLNAPVFQPVRVTPDLITEATEKVRREHDAAITEARERVEISYAKAIRDGTPYVNYIGGPMTVAVEEPAPCDVLSITRAIARGR